MNSQYYRWVAIGVGTFAVFLASLHRIAAQNATTPYVYTMSLQPLDNPKPLLADYPQWVEPVRELTHYEAPILVNDPEANLSVRAWRYSYHVRGIIEVPNQLQGSATALIVVHPWGIDDEQGWKTPDPAGVAFFCTPAKNHLWQRHVAEVVEPLIERLRPCVKLVMYSLPGNEDPIRKKLYRSIRGTPAVDQSGEAQRELKAVLGAFNYRGGAIPKQLTLSERHPVADFFRQLPALDPGPHYNPAGFWDLPIPVTNGIRVAPTDVVIYDGDGYTALKDFLNRQGIRHILLAGYATDICVKATTAGYAHLRQDFNVFLIGDATMATFPAADSPACATSAALRSASLDVLITQVSWIKPLP